VIIRTNDRRTIILANMAYDYEFVQQANVAISSIDSDTADPTQRDGL
jgi:hypothetical protein